MAKENLCIYRLIQVQSELAPTNTAFLASGRSPITYQSLYDHINSVGESLHMMGIGCNDRVATIIPDGPEAAVAFITIAANTTIAPLNPAYQAKELDFYLSDLNAKALIIHSEIDSVAIDVARKHGIPVIKLRPTLETEAGSFILEGTKCGEIIPNTFAQSGDIALMLHTSGTTSKPKLVSLTQENICRSSLHIQRTLQLVASDRCLNVMPLFHIHGLIAGILSSLISGASVVCVPGFHAPHFFEWMETFHPTWYTAVPTMHQAVLARSMLNQEIIAHNSLRFIRSSSSALPPQIMQELENVFGVPVLEAYGMTEASHQIACNPLPPRGRKAGSVGIADGPEVAIMDEEGNLLLPDKSGEIVIRGSNVMQGYKGDDSINKKAFTNGWFRTGDQGFIDTDGYIFVTGRLKEIINRGGEKISPREVDEVLMDHPAIAQAITFPIPHVRLGEEVAAAVVLRTSISVTEREIREFAATRIAAFKVPRYVVILDEIPKGPTGKVQRIGLAKKLGLFPKETQDKPKVPFVGPRTAMQVVLEEIWSQVLGLKQVGINDNFFELGGDSILATQIIARIQQTLQIDLPLITLFEEPTLADVALFVEHKQVVLNDGNSTNIQKKNFGKNEKLLIEIKQLSEHEIDVLINDIMIEEEK